jgi:hypothetical protein
VVSSPLWTVVVVRAWTEDGRLRVRLLRDGSDGPAQVATGSSIRAAYQLLDWLEKLEDGGGSAAEAVGDDGADPD